MFSLFVDSFVSQLHVLLFFSFPELQAAYEYNYLHLVLKFHGQILIIFDSSLDLSILQSFDHNKYKMHRREWGCQTQSPQLECFDFAGVLLVIMVPSILRNIQLKDFFAFGLLSSNKYRFRCCFSSFHICLDLYLTEVLSYVFTVQMLRTNTISKTISKTSFLLVFKIV